MTTLSASLYLVANEKLDTGLITSLTQTVRSVRRDLLGEQPIFAQITAPGTDQGSFLPLHPGAAAFYNGAQQSFMDRPNLLAHLFRCDRPRHFYPARDVPARAAAVPSAPRGERTPNRRIQDNRPKLESALGSTIPVWCDDETDVSATIEAMIRCKGGRSITRDTRRTSSSLRPSLGFRYTQASSSLSNCGSTST